MPEAQENSVLTSLKELRRQEEERVSMEKAKAEAKAEADRRAKEEAERRAKEEVERARRAEEDRKKRAEEEKLAREREEKLRVEEAERRARIEAETSLQRERMRLEVEAKAAVQSKPAPKGLIIGIVVGVLVIGTAVFMKITADHRAESAARAQASEKEKQELLRKQQEQELAFQAQIARLTKQLGEAKSEADREALKRQIDEATSRRAASSSSGASHTRAPRETTSAKPEAPRNYIKEKKKISDDPLDGL
jgi:colicin import membrane protein